MAAAPRYSDPLWYVSYKLDFQIYADVRDPARNLIHVSMSFGMFLLILMVNFTFPLTFRLIDSLISGVPKNPSVKGLAGDWLYGSTAVALIPRAMEDNIRNNVDGTMMAISVAQERAIAANPVTDYDE